MQAAGTNPVENRVVAQSSGAKLSNRNDAMPAFRDSRHPEIWAVTFFGYMPNKATAARVLPP
jgi:hypothetical protein